MTQRTDRIDELLRQEIGQALEREVTDPGIGFVTVTKVETVPDLSRARVWVSVIGSDEQRKETLAALRRAMPFVRHGLGSKIRIRRIPELDVRLDDSIERGTRILKIIDELEAGRNPDEIGGPGESLPTPVPRLHHEGDSLDEMLAEIFNHQQPHLYGAFGTGGKPEAVGHGILIEAQVRTLLNVREQPADHMEVVVEAHFHVRHLAVRLVHQTEWHRQTQSFEWFLSDGIRETFADISPIKDFTEHNRILDLLENDKNR